MKTFGSIIEMAFTIATLTCIPLKRFGVASTTGLENITR